MSEPDRTNLPIRRLPFQGVSNKTLDGSKPDWNLIGHPEAPRGAPNVLLVLIDDAGFGNPSTFGGPISGRAARLRARRSRSAGATGWSASTWSRSSCHGSPSGNGCS